MSMYKYLQIFVYVHVHLYVHRKIGKLLTVVVSRQWDLRGLVRENFYFFLTMFPYYLTFLTRLWQVVLLVKLPPNPPVPMLYSPAPYHMTCNTSCGMRTCIPRHWCGACPCDLLWPMDSEQKRNESLHVSNSPLLLSTLDHENSMSQTGAAPSA